MSNQMSPIVENPGVETSTNIPLGTVAMKLSNTSPYDLNFSGYGVTGDDVIPSGTEHMLYSEIYNSGVLQTELVNNRNVSPALPGVILVVAYYSIQEIPKGYWPVSIPFGTVNTGINVTSAQYLSDTTDVSNTTFITGQPTGDTSPALIAKNQGIIQVGSTTRNGLIDIELPSPNATLTPPTGSGNITIYEVFEATTGYHKTFVLWNAEQNTSASKFTYALASPYKKFAMIWSSNTHSMELLSGGVVQDPDVATSFGATSTQVNMPLVTWGFVSSAFDTLRFTASDGTIKTGIMIIEGI